MYKEKIINIQTGEEIYRDYTVDEINEVKKAQAQAELENSKLEQKTAARQSALSKLIDLGLTEEEIAAL